MQELASLEALGNASAVPVVIFLTQLIKNKVGKVRYRSDIVAFGLSILICTVWAFYNMTPLDFQVWLEGNALFKFKHAIDQLIVSFATWLAASKIYDMGHGDKKRGKEVSAQMELHISEKVGLQEEIVKLRTSGGTDEQTEEDPIVSDRLREILGG